MSAAGTVSASVQATLERRFERAHPIQVPELREFAGRPRYRLAAEERGTGLAGGRGFERAVFRLPNAPPPRAAGLRASLAFQNQ